MKRLRGYLWGTKFRIFSDHKALESIGKVGGHNARVQQWFVSLTAFDYTLEYRKVSANRKADFLPRFQSLPRNTTAVDLAAAPPWMMAVPSSSVPAGFALVPLRPPVLAWMVWCPAPRMLF